MPTCIQCNKNISIKRSRDVHKQFCDRGCVSRYHQKAKMSECSWCQSPIRLSKNKKYCSTQCFDNSRKSTYFKECRRCGNEFLCKNKAYERRGKAIFCSNSCATRKYSINECFFDQIDNCEKAYWLGFIYADGYQDGYEMVINLNSKDESHLHKLKRALNSEHPVCNSVTKKGHYTSSFRVGSVHICNSLNNLGCVKAKSSILKFPDFINNSKFVKDFVRGVFDGDGCIYIAKNGRKSFSIFSNSELFIIGLCSAFTKHGININYNKQGGGFVLKTSRISTIKKINNWFYENDFVCLERK